jgi:hypothetical protein
MKIFLDFLIFSLALFTIKCVKNTCSNLNTAAPKTADECYKFNNSTDYCCYMKVQGSDPNCEVVSTTEPLDHLLAVSNWANELTATMQCTANGPVTPRLNTCSYLGNAQPTKSDQCTSFNIANNLCCFESVNLFNKSYSSCTSRPLNVSLDDLYDSYQTMFPNKNFVFNCNSSIITQLAPNPTLIPNTCSTLKGMAPSNTNDCTKWSTKENSCCYVVTKYNGVNYPSCALLPTNSTSAKNIIDYVFGLVKVLPTVDCSSVYLKTFSSVLLLIVLSFI